MEMVDYSGEFLPDFSPDKLTRETLLKLLRMYSEYIRRPKVDRYQSPGCGRVTVERQ
ncbi:MAG: hypothetical protein WC749_07550 [Dehalococcoidia bacterium]